MRAAARFVGVEDDDAAQREDYHRRMASGVDRELLADSITRMRNSDEVWIDFVTGAIRGPSFQQRLIDGGGVEAGRVWGQVRRLAEVGVGAVYERGAFRACKHPFDFRSANADYQIGRSGEWRMLRDGRLYKTDPRRIDEPTAWEEPTPFDAVDVAERMTITEAADQDTIFGACKRFKGIAYGTGVRVPEIWETSEPLAVEVLVDRDAMLRRIEIEVASNVYRLATTLTLEYRTAPRPLATVLAAEDASGRRTTDAGTGPQGRCRVRVSGAGRGLAVSRIPHPFS